MNKRAHQRPVGFESRVGLGSKSRRDLASVLDERARVLARGEHRVRRSIGQALARLQEVDGFKKLGYSTQASYVTQNLGINCQSARDYGIVERALPVRPKLEAAYEEGEICYSNVRTIIRETPPGEDAEWARRAKWLTVEQLDAMLRQREIQHAPADKMTASLSDDKPRQGRIVEVNATPALLARWYVAVEMVQRYEAADVSFHHCVQWSSAEFLNGPGADALREVLRKRDEEAPAKAEEARPPFPFNDRHLDSEARWEQLERDCAQLVDRWLGLPWDVPDFHLPPFVVPRAGDTPRDLDARLREAARLYSQIHGHLRRLLVDIYRHRLFAELKFDSFDEYCQERLSIGPSTAHALLRLHERLRKCPDVAAHFDAGDLTQRQAELLSLLVNRDSENVWILHARQTTTRFLKEDIERAIKMRDVHPDEFYKSFGLPDRASTVERDIGGFRKRTRDAAMANYRRVSRASRKRLRLAQICEDGTTDTPPQTCAGRTTADSLPQTCAGGTTADASRETCAGGTTADAPRQTCAGGTTADAPCQTCAGGTTADAPRQTCAAATPVASVGALRARPYAARTGAYPFETFRQSIVQLLDEIAGENDHYDSDRCVTRLRFWLPAELEELWQDALAAGRVLLGGWGGIADCLELMLDAFLAACGDEALECLRNHPILDRQGWKCAVPTCNRRADLHVHHLCPRAQGGGQEPKILVGLCPSHHLHGVHEGWIRVTGFAPDGLLWELGVDHHEYAVLNVDDRGVVIPLSDSVTAGAA